MRWLLETTKEDKPADRHCAGLAGNEQRLPSA
jgi:hypothetical protein